MADLHLYVDREHLPDFRNWGVMLFLVFVCAGELGSEDLSLTTYWPAPGGVYNNLITQGSTNLGYPSGRVAIGKSSPPPIAILDVVGPATGSGITIRTSSTGNLRIGGGKLYFDGNWNAATGNYIGWLSPSNDLIFKTAGVERMRIGYGNASGVGVIAVNDPTPSGQSNVFFEVGNGLDASNIYAEGANYGCAGAAYSDAGSTTCFAANPGLCPALNSCVASWTSGYVGEYSTAWPPDTNTMICCNCGPAGCPAAW